MRIRPPYDLRAFGLHDASGIATRYDPQRGEWWDPSGRRVGHVDLDAVSTEDVQGVIRRRLDADPYPGRWHELPPHHGQGCHDPIELPPYHLVTERYRPPATPDGRDKSVRTVHECIHAWYGMHAWPPQSCAAPCTLPRVRVLPSPTEVQAVAALPDLVIRPLTDQEMRAVNALPDNHTQALSTDAEVPEWIDFLQSAIALLRANRDLLEWALCVAGTYHPDATPDLVRRIWGWLENKLDRGFNLYLVGCAGGDPTGLACTHPDYEGEDASAWATEGWQSPPNCVHDLQAGAHCLSLHAPWFPPRCEDAVPPEGDGVVVPIEVESRRQDLATWRTPPSADEAFLNVMRLGNGLVHELLHLAAVHPVAPFCPPGLSPDSNEWPAPQGSDCWRLQAQTVANYVYALYTRYGMSPHLTADATQAFLFAG